MSALYHVVRVNRDPRDTHADRDRSRAIELACPDDGDYLEHAVVKAADAGAARLMEPADGWLPLNEVLDAELLAITEPWVDFEGGDL